MTTHFLDELHNIWRRSKKIGTTQTVVSRIETANQNMTIETLVKIAQALKLEFVPILARKSQLPRIEKAIKEVKV